MLFAAEDRDDLVTSDFDVYLHVYMAKQTSPIYLQIVQYTPTGVSKMPEWGPWRDEMPINVC